MIEQTAAELKHYIYGKIEFKKSCKFVFCLDISK